MTRLMVGGLAVLLMVLLGSTSVGAAPQLTTISVGSVPIGVAVDPTTNTIYVANANSNTVSVING